MSRMIQRIVIFHFLMQPRPIKTPSCIRMQTNRHFYFPVQTVIFIHANEWKNLNFFASVEEVQMEFQDELLVLLIPPVQYVCTICLYP